MVMVGESAAAIMARHASVPPRRRWPSLVSIGLVALSIGSVALWTQMGSRTSGPKAPKRTQLSGLAPRDNTEASASRAALATYRSYQDAYAEAGRRANPDDPRLARYAGDPALVQVQTTLQMMAKSGLVYRGRFRGRLAVTNVSLARGTVHLTECQDISALSVVDTRTGTRIPQSGHLSRFPVMAEVRYYKGRWLVVNVTADRSRTC